MTKLLYLNLGRFLNGVPASDFETDDPVLIAQCIESGLYIEEADVAPPSNAWPTYTPSLPPEPEPESDAVSAEEVSQ